MEILFEDNYILVLNKPFGVPVSPDYSGAISLTDMAAEHIGRSKESIHIINRLDRPVGGIVIMAKDKLSAANISQQLNNNSIRKFYFAVVLGIAPTKGELSDYIKKFTRQNISKIVDKNTKGAKQAILYYENKGLSLDKDPDKEALSLLSIELKTGRHHQIRLQLSNIGFPIWGDRKYDSARKYNTSEDLALFSNKVSFKHPKTQKSLTIESPLPHKTPFKIF